MAADWIRDLESSDSRLHKEQVIDKALMAARLGSSEAQCFLFNCYQAYNPYFTFNVRQVPESEGLVGMPNPWTSFWALLEALRTRSVTGNRARDDIEHMMHLFDSEEWNGMARRVLLRDLRCGISEKTLNKILAKSEWRIPVFACQLARDSDDHPGQMTGRKRLEFKLDGVRVLALINGNSVSLVSRNGKPFDNFPQIAQAIEQNFCNFARSPDNRFVLDGEVVGESFQKLMRQAHRKTDANTSGMTYHIFDIIPRDDFERGICNKQQHTRTEILDRAAARLQDTDCLRIVPGIQVDLDLAEGRDIMTRYAQDCVKAGYEGIMIKSLDAPYECKRSSNWLKYKPVHDYDLKVIAVEEGTGKNTGKMGALVCEGDDQGRQIRVNVGSGFTDEQRQDYWDHRKKVIGQTAVIMCDAITQNQDGGYSLRFPRFKTFRDDK